MVDPLFALIIAVLIIAGIAFAFWPGSGIIAQMQSVRKNKKKIMIEDALKYLYDCEYKNLYCSLNSLAGNLSISADDSAALITRLENMGLVTTANGEVHLTTQGRSYALRVIRVHRLWEKYLADETTTPEVEWHPSAEEKEHTMTLEQADVLAAQLGNPVFDPHGDPIPSSSGDLPNHKGILLSNLKNGEFAHITHIEDEPYAIYAQLVAQGLHPGMQVHMIESTKERIKFEADGEECILAPIVAANVTITLIEHIQEIKSDFKSLSSLKIGEEGIVIGISKAIRGQQRRRLLDFGVVPGTIIKPNLKGTTGDPTAYSIRGASVALRKQQADMIFIKSKEENDDE